MPFDHKRFKSEVADLLDIFESGALDRAWDITCGLMDVTAKVDKRDDETMEEARQDAWKDLYRAFADEGATYTYWGMYEEMRHAVKDRADELESYVVDIGKSCMKDKTKAKPKRRRRKQEKPSLRATQHPHLSVVEG